VRVLQRVNTFPARRPAIGSALIVVVAVAAGLGGCATTLGVQEAARERIPVRTITNASPLTDGRARFRSLFCSRLRADGLASPEDPLCERWLWRLPDEPEIQSATTVDAPASDLPMVMVVTGALSECAGDGARPYADGVARLREAGTPAEIVVVGGRSGTSHNARQLADAIARSVDATDRPLILVGYSKGSLDILRFLVDFPVLAERVEAVVSVAGPIFGSPLADTAEPVYSALLDTLPSDRCAPGDGGVFESLRPEVAIRWLVRNPLPSHVRYYSIAAFATRPHVARALVPMWKMLNRFDPRNDGQVVAADAVIPGSTLLGYVNADHWGIAEHIETVHSFLAARPDPTPFPLDQLFLSIVSFVAADAAQGSGGCATGPRGGGQASSQACSSALNTRDRVRNLTPSGASSEKPPPRPGTTSISNCVCFQASNCSAPM
jgi:hypothetical protein